MDYTIGNIAPIVLFPFAAFVLNAFIVKKVPKFSVGLGCVAMFASFIYACRVFKDFVFTTYSTDYYVHKVFTWFDLGLIDGKPFNVDMGIYIDNMSAVLLFMVAGCALLIHIFSTFYMEHDARFGRFFVYLSLFTSAMLGLVLSENLLSVFIFWELMGFCSYSLIGFYYEKEGAGNASMKAFMTTRVGDVFFLVGILAIWTTIGSTSFVDIYAAIASGAFENLSVIGMPLATFSAIAIFLGTVGKSAQFPLQVWLPDAMWGPTPCSALIHAATMVAAGVYLSLRMYPLMDYAGITTAIAYIGGITAFGAATIALIQTDIKAVLAYSTISQLGYMVLGIGVGAYNAAFMHLITHAVFKACLFLAAGSVIHSLHDHHTDGHVQEMPRMGGLRKKMPFTFIAMLCCTFAISGFPLFSGFVSKDRILGDALIQALHHKSMIIPAVLGFVAALLTAFYMFRMMFLTFFGEPRDKELYDHTDVETLSWNRNVPLLILTVFTLGGWYSGSFTGQGWVTIPGVKNKEWFSTLIVKPKLEKFKEYKRQEWGPVDDNGQFFEKAHYDANHGMTEEKAHHVHQTHQIGALMSIFIALFGFFIAYMMYIKKAWNPGWWVSRLAPWYRALRSKYFFDDLYIKVIIQKGLLRLNNFLAWVDMGIYDRYIVDGWAAVNRTAYRMSNWFDDKIVDTVGVDGTGASVRLFNVVLRTIQTGKLQFYIMIFVFVLVSYVWTLV